MKVAAFNSSPRRDGNTAILVRKVFAELEAAGALDKGEDPGWAWVKPRAPQSNPSTKASRKRTGALGAT